MTLVRTNYPSFSSLFDDFLTTEADDWRRKNYSSSNTTLPKVNIIEDGNGYTVEMAAPGLTKGDFNIQLENNILTISSEKQEDVNNGDNGHTRREFSYQAFTRSFTIPESANGEKIGAKYANGILTVSIPKKEEAKPKPPKSIAIS